MRWRLALKQQSQISRSLFLSSSANRAELRPQVTQLRLVFTPKCKQDVSPRGLSSGMTQGEQPALSMAGAGLLHMKGLAAAHGAWAPASMARHVALTVQREPVMLGGRQGWQSSGFIFKHHRVGDDLIVESNLQGHKSGVMS